MWTKFNEWLNGYGGLIGLISLLVSIFIFFKTGQIKNNIKNLLNHSKYVEQKNRTKQKLMSILQSIQEDSIYDLKIIGEVNREIATLEHYSVYFDKKTKNNIENIKKVLKNRFDQISSEQIINAVNKIIGDLEVNDTYVG